jgi:hypothetical protein
MAVRLSIASEVLDCLAADFSSVCRLLLTVCPMNTALSTRHNVKWLELLEVETRVSCGCLKISQTIALTCFYLIVKLGQEIKHTNEGQFGLLNA